MNTGLYWALLRYTLLGGAALLAFIAHHRYSQAPLTMDELVRATAAVPHAAAQNLTPLLRAAAARGQNYLAQVLAGHIYSTRAVPVTQARVWDGFFAALAVLCIYRVATLCCTRGAGLVCAFMLASVAPSLWGAHAMVMTFALVNFELFLHAVRHDTFVRWLLWLLACLLLMSTGVHAELLLLQTWFLGLVAVWCAWRVLAARLPDAGAPAETPRRRRRAAAGMMEQLQRDAGVARLAAMFAGVSIVVFLLVAVLAVFFTRFALTPTLIIYIAVWGAGLSIAAGVVLLFLPLYSRERAIIIDRILSGQVIHSIDGPEQIFGSVRRESVLNMLLAYAGAMVLFIPVLYIVHAHVNVFVRTWDGAVLVQTMRQTGMVRAVVFMALPLVWLCASAGLYAAGVLPRGRCIGAVCVTMIGSLYLVQQRYAACAAPFFFIALAGLVVVAVEAVQAFLPPRETALSPRAETEPA